MRYLLLIAPLVACTTANPVNLADGSQGYSISCPGAVRTFGDCLAKAGEMCGVRGYEVVNQDGSVGAFAGSSGSFQANRQYASGSYGAYGGTIHSRNVMVKCK